MTGLYVHIPFCIKKCNYCDFCSFPQHSFVDRQKYISSLKNEILSYSKSKKVKINTIFFGGGTPSLLLPCEFIDIYKSITQTFDLSDLHEFTVEANPKTLTSEKMSCYVSCGVNRISIGLQTIHENELKILGRVHDLNDFISTYELVKSAGINNISVDLMYGIPNQTKQSFKESIDFVVSLDIPHISAYGLIIEEGTPFWQQRSVLELPNEDTEAEMYEEAVSFLTGSNYCHYEISNYSKPGFESRHNLNYWKNGEYIGVGISAYSYFESERYGNTSKIQEYLQNDFAQYRVREKIDKNAQAYEYAMLALRLRDGFSLQEYKLLFGKDFLDERIEKIRTFQKNELLILDNDRIFLTDKGFYVSNSILSELL